MKRNQLVFMKIRTLSQRLSAAVTHSVDISFLITANIKCRLLPIVFTLISLFPGNSVFGVTQTWTGTTSSNWSDGSNWESGSIPSSNNDALIPGGCTYYPIISTTIIIRKLSINSIGTGASVTVISGGSLNTNGQITVAEGGALIQFEGTILALRRKPIIAGTFTQSGGTYLSDQDMLVTGVLNQSGGLIHLAKNTSTNPAKKLVINGGTVNQSGGTILVKNYDPTAGSYNQTGSNALLKIWGTWKPSSLHTFNSTSGTVEFSKSSAGDFRSTGSQFNNTLVDAGVNPGFSSQGNSVVLISGNFENNYTGLNVTNNATFTFNGTGAQNITSASSGSNSTFFNLLIDNPSGTVSLVSDVNMSGAFTVKAGSTFNLASNNFGAGKAPASLELECGAVLGSVITGPGTFTLGSDVSVINLGLGNSGASISSGVDLRANRIFTVANDGTLAIDFKISGEISGTFGITKAGVGTIQLSGINTFTGVTAVNAGILSVATIGNGGISGNLGAASAVAGNIVLGGGTLQYTGVTASTNRNFTLAASTTSTIEVTDNTLTITGASANTSGALIKTGDGTLLLSGANQYTGVTRVNSGTLKYGINNALSNGAVTVAGGTLDIANFNDAVGDVTLFSGTIAGTFGALTGTSFTLRSGLISAILSGSGALTKISTGTVTLSGLNTYTGKTTISAGTLGVNTLVNVSGGSSALGAPSTVANGTIDIATGTLKYIGTGNTSNRIINLTANGGTIDASGTGALTLTGGVTGNTYGLVLAGTGTGILSGPIATTTGSLTKDKSGIWTLMGTNTYSGSTSIAYGILNIGTAGVIPNSSAILMTGGTLQTGAMSGFNETVGTLKAGAYSTIALGTGAHSLNFAASSGISWNPSALINISGWQGGYNGTSGTAGKLFIGSSTGGLTAAQLGQIRFFNGISYVTAAILATGEIVPTSIPFVIPAPPSALSYTTPNEYPIGIAIIPLVPVVTGFVENYSISPDLPEGLSINPHSGIISGIPVELSSQTIYTVTASNIVGSTTFDVTIIITATVATGGSGYWSSTTPNAPWPNGDVPTILSDVIITAGNFVTVDIPDAQCKSITIGTDAGTAILNYTTNGVPFLKVEGEVVVGGSGGANRIGLINFSKGSTLSASVINLGGIAATSAPGIINMNNGGTLITGAFKVNNTSSTWLPGTGTVQMTSTNTLPGTIFTSFNNLQINAGTTTTGTAIPIISGSLTVNAGAIFSLNHPVGASSAPSSLEMECGAVTGSSLSGTGTLTLGGNITVNSVKTGNGGASISVPVVLGGTRTCTVADNGTSAVDLTVSGIVSGAFGLNKSGAGTMVLSGLNLYTGKTTIFDGILSINTLRNVSGGASSLGAPTTVTNGTIDISGTGTLLYAGSGHSSNRVINLTGSDGTIDASGSGTLILTGGITGSNFGLVLDGSGTGIESGVIGTGSGSLTKLGDGIWTLSGNNTYNGSTFISEGTLKLGASERIANTSALIVDAIFDMAGFNETVSSLEGEGTVTSSSSGTSFLTAGGNNTNTEFAGIIEDGTGKLAFTKAGNGTLTLSGDNTYSGVTNIGSGTIKIGMSDGTIPDLSAVIVSGTLDLAGNNETIGSLAGSGSVTSSETDPLLLTVGDDNSSTLFSGVIQDGKGTVSLKKSGDGSFTLSGNNNYSGETIISGGTLLLGASNRIDNNSTITLDGGVFRTGAGIGYNETVGILNVNASSTIALGTGNHTLSFAASNGQVWSPCDVITVTGWSGSYNGTGGTAGKIKAGTSSIGLTALQVAQIRFFNGTTYFAATILSNGEIVPLATAAVSPGPVVTSTTPGNRCGEGTVSLGATASVGIINWYSAPVGGVSLGAGTSFITPSISVSTTFYAEANNNGCKSTARTPVLASITPSTEAEAGEAVVTCSNSGAVNITAGSSAANYAGLTWSSSGSGTFANANSLTTATYTPGVADISAGSVILMLAVSGNSPCGTVVSTKILTITPLPVATFSYTGTPYCLNSANPLPLFSGGGTAGNFSSTAGLNFVNSATGEVNLATSLPGTYIVTNTISAAGGCASVSETNYITIYPDLPVSIYISASANPVCSESSVTFIATTTNGGTAPAYQWQVNGSNVGASTATYTYTPANNDAVTCILISNALPCTSGIPAISNTMNMIVNPCNNKWKGTISSDWNVPGNWSLNIVPEVDANIFFDDVTLNHCQLDQDRSVTNITNNQSVYRIICNGHKLTVKGNTLFTNGAQIDASAINSTVEYTGASSQFIPAGCFYNEEVFNLVLNNPYNVILNGSLHLLNALTGFSGHLDAKTNMPDLVFAGTTPQTIESSQYLNDEIYNLIVDNPEGVSLNTDFTVNNILSINSGRLFIIGAGNNLTVNGLIANTTGTTGFILKSDATGTASLIHNTNNVGATVQRYISGDPEACHFISSSVTNQNIGGSWTPTGTYGNTTGYDLYVWNEPTNCWIYKLDITSAVNWNMVHPGTEFIPGRGYLYSVQAANPTNEFIGNLNNGSMDIGLSFSSTDATLKGFNFVGNPYPSSIDWQAPAGWTRSDLLNSGGGYDIWIWNPAANNYGVCNSATGICTNSITRYIAPMQGFYVQAVAAGNLGINNNVRVNDVSGSWFKNSGINTGLVSMVVQSDDNHSFDEARLQFGYYTNQPGAAKLFSHVSTAPSLFLSTENENSSVRYLTDIVDNPTVPVLFKPGENGNYTLKCTFNPDEFEIVMLEDRQANYIQDMKMGNTYSFKASKTDSYDRFVLHFGADNNSVCKELPARIYSDENRLFIDLTLVSNESEALVYDVTGRLLLKKTLQGLQEHQIYVNATSQILLVQLNNRQGNICRKLFHQNIHK